MNGETMQYDGSQIVCKGMGKVEHPHPDYIEI